MSSAVQNIDYDRLWEFVAGQVVIQSSIHGLAHWKRVERNGLYLAGRAGGDLDVVRLFAVFHDSRRYDDGFDLGHGARGAEFAGQLRGHLFELSDAQFELLHHACTYHADGLCHEDPTIGSCWDADRFDLTRIGVTPAPEYMSTLAGREMAREGGRIGDD